MAYRTYYYHFEYNIMLFRLIHAPVIIKGNINKILIEKLNIFIIIYLDDIFIYAENKGEDHIKVIQ